MPDNILPAVAAGLVGGTILLVALSALGDQALSSSILPAPPAAEINETDGQESRLVFDTVTAISENTGMYIPNPPDVVVSENSIYVAWRDLRRPESDPGSTSIGILFRTSLNLGENFGNEMRLGDNGSILFPPQIAAFRNFVSVVWEGLDSSGQFQIFLRTSKDYGATFGQTLNLSRSSGEAREPQIAATIDNLYIVWEDNSMGNSDIFLITSPDFGDSFTSPVNVSNNAGDSHSPQIMISEQDVFIIWN